MSNGEKISLREFGRRIGCSDTAVRKAIKSGKISAGVVYDTKGKPLILPEVASAEWSKNYNPAYSSSDAIRGKIEDTHQANTDSPEVAQSPGGNATLQAAKRAKAVYDAKLVELEYRQKTGELVRKEDVYRALFAFGQEIKSRIQAVPDRVIDDILAAPSRNGAHLILYNALADVLEQLSDVSTVKIAKDES